MKFERTSFDVIQEDLAKLIRAGVVSTDGSCTTGCDGGSCGNGCENNGSCGNGCGSGGSCADGCGGSAVIETPGD